MRSHNETYVNSNYYPSKGENNSFHPQCIGLVSFIQISLAPSNHLNKQDLTICMGSSYWRNKPVIMLLKEAYRCQRNSTQEK